MLKQKGGNQTDSICNRNWTVVIVLEKRFCGIIPIIILSVYTCLYIWVDFARDFVVKQVKLETMSVVLCARAFKIQCIVTFFPYNINICLCYALVGSVLYIILITDIVSGGGWRTRPRRVLCHYNVVHYK